MKKRILFTTLCVALVLAGCNPSQPQSTQVGYLAPMGEPQAWIDAPLNESRLPLAPYQVVFHITDSQKVMKGELLINDQVVFTTPNPDPANKLFTIKYMWDPGAPGRYVLGVRAQNGEGTWGPVTESVVFISEATATPLVELTPTLAPTIMMSPTETVTPTLTPTETVTPTLAPTPGFANLNIEPDLVYYGYCSPFEALVSAEASDPAGITAVVVFYRLKDENGNTTEWLNSAMDPQGGARYTKSVNMNILASQTGFDQSFGTFKLEVQLVIQNSLGQMTRSPVFGDVVVEYCRR
jgi:hypothetical protein